MRGRDLAPCQCCGRGVAHDRKPTFFLVTVAEYAFVPESGAEPVQIAARAMPVCKSCGGALDAAIAELALKHSPVTVAEQGA